MGFTIVAFLLEAISGFSLWGKNAPTWMRSSHVAIGMGMVGLILLLLGIGIVGTIGHYGSLGHSSHLWAGITVVELALLSAWSGVQIPHQAWARPVHWGVNSILGITLVWVSITGWEVVQKYL